MAWATSGRLWAPWRCARADSGERSKLDVKAGDRILIGKYSGSEIKIEGDELVILREDEILAVLG